MQTSRDQKKRQAVAFFTHMFDPLVARRYRKLKKDVGSRARTFILAQTGVAIPRRLLPETHFFDFARLRGMAAATIGNRVVPGNVHLGALDFYNHHGDFDFYWFVEYDVVFTGDWSVLMKAVRNDPADLLAAHIRTYAQEPDWPWWKSLDLPGCTLGKEERIRSFLPIYRISRAALEAVKHRVAQGWIGHYEGLVPCAMESASLSIADFGGAGHWTPKDRHNMFYESYSSQGGMFLEKGTHRHRPSHMLPLLRKNTLFHPVKHDSVPGSTQWLKRILRNVRDYWL